MKLIALKSNCALALVIAGLLASGQVIADKPSWAGGGKGEKSEQKGKSANSESGYRGVDERSQREYFGDGQRTAVRNYYNEEFSHGRCPPGLAKKHNGCMPPGQAKKWTIGRPLPREVIYYQVPPALVGQFGQPPAGHRYVRVASDILLIAIGTGMVVDAIRDLGRI